MFPRPARISACRKSDAKARDNVCVGGFTMNKIAFALLAFCAALVPLRAQEQDCRLKLLASLPMRTDRTDRLIVAASIEGHPAQMMVDTGSPIAILSHAYAEAQNLRQIELGKSRMQLYGGIALKNYVRVENFEFGGVPFSQVIFLVTPNDQPLADTDGVVGSDFLSNFDADFDFVNSKLNLFAPHPCDGRAVYWTQGPVAKIPFETGDGGGHIVVPVELDGHAMKAVLDTGASTSVVNLESTLETFGLTKDSPILEPVPGSGKDQVYRYPFKVLTVGGLTVNNPNILLIPMGLSHFGHEILLGIPILRQLHLYIAYKERMLYITPASAQ